MSSMKNWLDKHKQVRDTLEDISPSFCLAKWKQVTIHLGVGHTHSCHHPRTHVIPIEEIKKSPDALHNTEYKKQQRKMMIEGVRPSECDYCWKAEDSGQFSDRTFKSAKDWAFPHINEVISAGYVKSVNPSYLEVSFSNVCNMKCSYCYPNISSQWFDEIKKYGPYPTSTSIPYNSLEWLKKENKMPILEKEYNPYVEAFWQWWPDLYKDLHTFRITGGEPLLNKNTFKVLDYIIENPRKDFEININTNLCVPENIFEKFLEKIKIIEKKSKVTVHTSCEAHGKKAEYIRHGMDYNQWLDNCYRFLKNTKTSKLGIMSTYNALSVTSYTDFLKDMIALRDSNTKRFWFVKRDHPLWIDIPYLNNPKHQAVSILTKDFLSQIISQIEFMKNSNFDPMEVQKLERIYSIFSPTILNSDSDVLTHRRDFVLFVDEHDKRRGTNFLDTFPEMEKFYNFCKSL